MTYPGPEHDDLLDALDTRLTALIEETQTRLDAAAATAPGVNEPLETVLSEMADAIRAEATTLRPVLPEQADDLDFWAERVQFAGLPEEGIGRRRWRDEVIDALTVVESGRPF